MAAFLFSHYVFRVSDEFEIAIGIGIEIGSGNVILIPIAISIPIPILELNFHETISVEYLSLFFHTMVTRSVSFFNVGRSMFNVGCSCIIGYN